MTFVLVVLPNTSILLKQFKAAEDRSHRSITWLHSHYHEEQIAASEAMIHNSAKQKVHFGDD